MQDIRKQFSLDWLTGEKPTKSTTKQSPSMPDPLTEAILFYGQPIMKHLSEAQNQQMRQHELALALQKEVKGFKYDEFYQVIRHLTQLGYIQVLIEDPTGNNLLSLQKQR